MNLSAIDSHQLTSSSTKVGSRSFRDVVVRGKVCQLIDILLQTIQAGTGRFQPRPLNRMDDNDVVPVIDSPHGWTFAYEGGAHTLFRNTRGARFVYLSGGG
jgi:hypothetical protein